MKATDDESFVAFRAARKAEEDLEAILWRYYCWWTCSLSWTHVKLGPLTITWYRWTDGWPRIEGIWNARVRLFCVPWSIYTKKDDASDD